MIDQPISFRYLNRIRDKVLIPTWRMGGARRFTNNVAESMNKVFKELLGWKPCANPCDFLTIFQNRLVTEAKACLNALGGHGSFNVSTKNVFCKGQEEVIK